MENLAAISDDLNTGSAEQRTVWSILAKALSLHYLVVNRPDILS